VAGLPGTGKSLVIRELAHAAAEAGRTVHSVQWDVVRPAFEAAPAGRRYPLAAGVTHVVIRRAAGAWVRPALAAWHARHPEAVHLLIGELPLVGGRFIELVRPAGDAAEALLASPSCRFVVPVPSREVRIFIERERDRRMAQPHHAREREDAPGRVLRALWGELADAARRLVLPEARPLGTGDGPIPYDPAVYEAVYRRVLSRRHAEVLPLTRVVKAGNRSAYDLDVPVRELLPSERDAEETVRAVEACYPDLALLEAEAARWYEP
jgi:hypothetical protein